MGILTDELTCPERTPSAAEGSVEVSGAAGVRQMLMLAHN